MVSSNGSLAWSSHHHRVHQFQTPNSLQQFSLYHLPESNAPSTNTTLAPYQQSWDLQLEWLVRCSKFRAGSWWLVQHPSRKASAWHKLFLLLHKERLGLLYMLTKLKLVQQPSAFCWECFRQSYQQLWKPLPTAHDSSGPAWSCYSFLAPRLSQKVAQVWT